MNADPSRGEGTGRATRSEAIWGAVLGIFLDWIAVAVVLVAGFGEVRVGPWRTSMLTGTADAGLLTRARIAVGGLLALTPSESRPHRCL